MRQMADCCQRYFSEIFWTSAPALTGPSCLIVHWEAAHSHSLSLRAAQGWIIWKRLASKTLQRLQAG